MKTLQEIKKMKVEEVVKKTITSCHIYGIKLESFVNAAISKDYEIVDFRVPVNGDEIITIWGGIEPLYTNVTEPRLIVKKVKTYFTENEICNSSYRGKKYEIFKNNKKYNDLIVVVTANPFNNEHFLTVCDSQDEFSRGCYFKSDTPSNWTFKLIK